EIADRVSVLRQGEIVGDGDPSQFSEADLAEMMVGRPVSFSVGRGGSQPGAAVLELDDVSLFDDKQDSRLTGVSLSVHEGEIVGVAGVQGNGQTELVDAIAGLASIAGGGIAFCGTDITGQSVRRRHQMGIAHIPEDRQKSGIVAGFSVAENMVLNRYYDETISRGVQIDWQQAQRQAAEACMKFDVRTPNVFLGAGSLSGGNQQKMVVARELERPVKLVVASQPTRGVDVGSIEFIHQQLVSCCEQGNGVLIISSELDEILDLSDRIYVMFEGRITAEFDNRKRDADRNAIGLAMAGAGRTEAA
ncbi:MAG: ATP-binding cassette domain-containing protein, partial [Pseudomonadota bacterium]|nr:ATP-binding cassette domain-containing protein [Pseudomonadota bacterium]